MEHGMSSAVLLDLRTCRPRARECNQQSQQLEFNCSSRNWKQMNRLTEIYLPPISLWINTVLFTVVYNNIESRFAWDNFYATAHDNSAITFFFQWCKNIYFNDNENKVSKIPLSCCFDQINRIYQLLEGGLTWVDFFFFNVLWEKPWGQNIYRPGFSYVDLIVSLNKMSLDLAGVYWFSLLQVSTSKVLINRVVHKIFSVMQE